MKLTLTPDMQLGDSPKLAMGDPAADVIQYTVGGWPAPGQVVLISKKLATRHARWQIRRRLGLGEWRKWEGDYKSPEAALAALQAEVDGRVGA
jgi:hypothetical protein